MNSDKSPGLLAFEACIDALQVHLTDAVASVDGSTFRFKDWVREEGGGGRMATIRGRSIEKGAVHVSKVSGQTNPLTGNPFHAAGLSLILHPANPHAATVHFNIRRFEEASGGWWGGGLDLTPMGVWHDKDVAQFHDVLANRLGARYPEGKAGADEYFHVPHRGRARGAGGVFYDHIKAEDGRFMQGLGDCFLEAYLPLLERRKDQPFTRGDRLEQLRDRGVYVEFNLLYDRGTKFGFQSGGNVEAILSSLPPVVAW